VFILAHCGQNIIFQPQVLQINLRNLERLSYKTVTFVLEDNAGKPFAGARDCVLKTEGLVKNLVIGIILFP
jgi:hypothetical protein